MKSSLWRTFWLLTFLLLCSVVHAGKVTYIYTDPQGTPIAEADEQGNITKTFDYRPYGQQALGDPPNGPGYTGHVNDPDTDLVYMQARYYDPEMGRFLSVDPAGPAPGDVFGFNQYAYAGNNPINRIDPNGRQEEDAEVDVYESIQNARTLRPIIIPSTASAARSILDPVVLNELQKTESYSRSAAEQFENVDRAGNEILRNTAERGDPISEAAARAPSGFTTAYRAVSQAEYDDALATGSFNQGPNSLEGKWFADSYDNALLHGDALEGPGNYKILEADLPNNAPSLFKLQNLDGRGPATYIHLDDLEGVTPRPYGGR